MTAVDRSSEDVSIGRADPDERRLVDWIERHLGGRVVSLVREGRWRPSWVAAVERAGSTMSLRSDLAAGGAA